MTPFRDPPSDHAESFVKLAGVTTNSKKSLTMLDMDDNTCYRVSMSKKNDKTMTETLKDAIEKSEVSRYRIAKATGLTEACLSRFMKGETSLRLDKADILATYLGLRLTLDPEATQPKPTPENLARPMLAKNKKVDRKDK